jgi:Protein of unknown function (DUF5818)
MKNNLIRGSVLALTLSVATMGSLYAQNAQPAQDSSQSAQSSQAQPAVQDQTAKEFTGTIVKHGSMLVLKDSSANVSYKVDDESKVKDYLGKQVKVTGTLDVSSNVIHVDSIEVIS